MRHTEYQTIVLDQAPATGDNPPAGAIYQWSTVTGGVLSIHYRTADGTDRVLSVGEGGGLSETAVIGLIMALT